MGDEISTKPLIFIDRVPLVMVVCARRIRTLVRTI